MKALYRKVMSSADSKRLLILVGLLLAMMLLLGIFVPSKFYTLYNMGSMAFQLPELGLVVFGMLIVVITGGIDLSITYGLALSGIVGGLILQAGEEAGMNTTGLIILAVLALMATAVLCGAINGFFVAVLKVHPWLTTLGTMSLYQGISIILTNGGSISGFPAELYDTVGNGTILGIPVPMLMLILVAVTFGILLHKTVWGRRLVMVGSNEKVALYSGISIRRIKFSAYVLCSVFAGIGGLVMLARYNSAKVDHGSTYLMQSIAVIVLSGANINGGSANVFSVCVTLIIMQFLYTGINMLGGNRYIVVILTGVILVGVLLINTVIDMRRQKREIMEMRKKNEEPVSSEN